MNPSTMITAAMSSTRSIDCANPSRNGRARRGSSALMNDESLIDGTVPAPPCPPSMASTGAFAGSARTAGSASAAWNPAVGASRANALAMLPPTVENRIDRKTAVPSVPPTCRKNSAEAVATPMSLTWTAFCTARTSGCIVNPRPSPKTRESAKTTSSVVSTESRENSSAPMPISNVPITGKIL